jgi:hypothetical protein
MLHLFLLFFIGSRMTWYVVSRCQKPGVYDSWGVCSEYVLCYSRAAPEVISQGWMLRQLMLLFLNSRTKIACHNKLPNSGLGKI